MKSFPVVIKWFGSKRPVAEQLSQYFPYCKCYYEPFVGGGSMLPFAKANQGIANDIIPELIVLWNKIKESPNEVATEYEKRWNRLQNEGANVYYEIRDSFNATKNCYDFLFLTRTCVNGMIRYNEKGEFNNSFHLSRQGINPNTLRNIIFQWSQVLQKIDFINCDYRDCLKTVTKEDFVFLDPPYGGTKDRYTRTAFNLDAFFTELERMNQIGAKWMLTFDGSAGDRVYSFAPPSEIYKYCFKINTGISSFSKVIDKRKDEIQESVYLNFNPRQLKPTLF